MKRHIPVQIEWHPNPAQPVPVYRQILEWMYGRKAVNGRLGRVCHLSAIWPGTSR